MLHLARPLPVSLVGCASPRWKPVEKQERLVVEYPLQGCAHSGGPVNSKKEEP